MHFRTILPSLCLLAASAFVNAAPQKVARQSGDVPKVVVAHHIVGNTASYAVSDWTSDMQLAQANGIDGFALNVGNDAYTPTQAANAYQAAEQLNSGFKLFFSFDMSSYPCSAASDADELRSLTLTYATSSAQLTVDGKAFVSTFAGESCTFGQGSVAQGWETQFTQQGDMVGKVFFVPSFFIDPATFNQYAGVMDGAFNFNSGWPIALTIDNAGSLVPGVNFDAITASEETELEQYFDNYFTTTDDQYISGLAGLSGTAQAYMAAVSPWFFTHFGPDSYNKNWIYDGDEWQWVSRWNNIIAKRNQIALVEITTWNDFGESHYIGPQHGDLPPGSDAWVDGFDHQGWLRLTNYFATQFKTGSAPAITQDLLVMWARPSPKYATSPDPVPQPTNYQLFQDKMWAVVLATSAGSLTLSGSASNTQTFNISAGLNTLELPLNAGDTMHGTLTRNGATVIDLVATGFTFNSSPSSYNYNAFTAYATS